ncbi:MAG TPA: hypothetical protein VH186_34495 [Chloroflexia bacterium]|nr:hypothetical protein [Chloroflexia bacterium]
MPESPRAKDSISRKQPEYQENYRQTAPEHEVESAGAEATLARKLGDQPAKIENTARKLSAIPSPSARQKVFRAMAHQRGNSYANRIAVIQRKPSQELGVLPEVEKAAKYLALTMPGIDFTSGIRKLEDQARAMASNFPESNGVDGLDWLTATYKSGEMGQNIRQLLLQSDEFNEAHSKYKDARGKAKNSAAQNCRAVVQAILQKEFLGDQEKYGMISPHLQGRAFDISGSSVGRTENAPGQVDEVREKGQKMGAGNNGLLIETNGVLHMQFPGGYKFPAKKLGEEGATVEDAFKQAGSQQHAATPAGNSLNNQAEQHTPAQAKALLTPEEETRAMQALHEALSQNTRDSAATDKAYFAVRGNHKITSSSSPEAKIWRYINTTLLPQAKVANTPKPTEKATASPQKHEESMFSMAYWEHKFGVETTKPEPTPAPQSGQDKPGESMFSMAYWQRKFSTSSEEPQAKQAATTATSHHETKQAVAQLATSGNLDELDQLMGLQQPAAHYNEEQLSKARELANHEQDVARRARLYLLLQAKVPYHSQRDNVSQDYHKDWANKDNPNQVYGKVGDVMCNLTSLAMALEGVGFTIKNARSKYPQAPQELTQFEDVLEWIRRKENLDARTQHSTWIALSNKLGLKLDYAPGASTYFKQDKEWWVANPGQALSEGKSVVMGVHQGEKGHVIRLQSVTEEGIIVDDPFGHLKIEAGDGYGWDKKNASGTADTKGEDDVLPWSAVKNHSFFFLMYLTAPDAPANITPKKATPASPPNTPAPAPAPSHSQSQAAPASPQKVDDSPSMLSWDYWSKKLSFSDNHEAGKETAKPAPAKTPGAVGDWHTLLPKVGEPKKKNKKEPEVLAEVINQLSQQIEQNRESYSQTLFSGNPDKNLLTGKRDKHYATYGSRVGIKYDEGDAKFNGHVDKAIENVSANDKEKATLSAIAEELKSEGGFNSINTYDNQGLTWGKGFAAGGKLGDLLQEYFKLVPGARAEFYKMGITCDEKNWVWVVDTDDQKQYGGSGNADTALDRLNKKHPKMMANIAAFMVKQGEDHAQELVQAHFAVEMSEIKKHSYVTEWPKANYQFIQHQAHWLPACFGWSNWKESGKGSFSDVIKRYFELVQAHMESSVQIKGGAKIFLNVPATWAMGKVSGQQKSWFELSAPQEVEDVSSGGYYVKLKIGDTTKTYKLTGVQ